MKRERLKRSGELRIIWGWLKTCRGKQTNPAVGSLLQSALELIGDAGKLLVADEAARGDLNSSIYEPVQED